MWHLKVKAVLQGRDKLNKEAIHVFLRDFWLHLQLNNSLLSIFYITLLELMIIYKIFSPKGQSLLSYQDFLFVNCIKNFNLCDYVTGAGWMEYLCNIHLESERQFSEL